MTTDFRKRSPFIEGLGFAAPSVASSHGRPVSAERLADQLWAGEPPARGAASLQVVISQLRGVLEPARTRRAPATHLISSAAGYALRAETDAVDVWRFEAEARRAITATPLDCVTSSTAALHWWGAAPYADSADTDLVRSEVARLAELRLTMIEARASALLELGHPGHGHRRSREPGRGPSLPGKTLVIAGRQSVPDPATGGRAGHLADAA